MIEERQNDGEMIEESQNDGEMVEEEQNDGEMIEEEQNDGEMIEERQNDGEMVEEEQNDGEMIEERQNDGEMIEERQNNGGRKEESQGVTHLFCRSNAFLPIDQRDHHLPEEPRGAAEVLHGPPARHVPPGVILQTTHLPLEPIEQVADCGCTGQLLG